MTTQTATPDFEAIEKKTVEEESAEKVYHLPEVSRKLRGVGITRKDKSLSKKNRKISAKSAKINRNKKRHHWTSKEKKSR